MENLEKIRLFVSYSYGSGNGYGSGYGDGDGNGNGSGNGYGNGSGNGYGNGNGCGNGNGSGYGDGDGNGCGNGKLFKIILNGKKIYNIDHIPTIIEFVKKDFAKGFIVKDDLTLTPCYIAKSENIFAHGETLKKAYRALEEKLIEDMPVEERIEKFLQEFKPNVKYPNKSFLDWHHILTGSCLFGRQQFCKNKGIDLKGEITVSEFIELTQDDYGGEIIKELKERYKETVKNE